MSTSAKAMIHLQFESRKQLNTLLEALKPEAEAPSTHRSIVKLEIEGHILTIIVNAEDTVALRATLNAYLHWIQSTIKVIEVVKNA